MLKPNGTAGTITVQNSSPTVTAINVGSIGLPIGVTQTSLNCATILPQGTCVLTYTPGSVIVPTTTFQIKGTNTPAVNASVSVTDAQLTISLDTLLLATKGVITKKSGCNVNCKPGAKTRTITITNGSMFTASNVNFTISPPLPTSTTISPTIAQGCGNISANGGKCVLKITPGNQPTANAPDAPTPSVLTASGDNTNSVTSSITVLTYGNKYQSGYVFSMDDSTENNISIQGKVSSLSNVNGGLPWDPSLNCNSTSDTGCVKVSINSHTDGAENTASIVNAMTEAKVSELYAALACKNSPTGGFNWYLPAVCELGYDILNQFCITTDDYPIIQNMHNVTTALAPTPYTGNGTYSTSTQLFVHSNQICAGNTNYLGYVLKDMYYPVLCAHEF